MATNTNKEALLVLYLANELSAAERADVEGMIATDEPMRHMLEELRGAQGRISEALARLDESQPMPPSEIDAVSRRTVRTMRQWQVEQIARQAAAPVVRSQPRRGLAGWRGYALAAAIAILFIGLYVYWGQQGMTSTPPVTDGDDQQTVVSIDDWRNIEAPVDSSNPTDREAAEFAAAFDLRPVAHERLANLEQEMSKLNELAALGQIEAGNQ